MFEKNAGGGMNEAVDIGTSTFKGGGNKQTNKNTHTHWKQKQTTHRSCT